MLEKPNKDKRYVSNWRPIPLLNLNPKIISKTLTIQFKKVLPVLICPVQTAYVNGRFIGKSEHLISNIIEVCNKEYYGYIMTTDFENIFDSMNHALLIGAFKKCGLGDNFSTGLRYY